MEKFTYVSLFSGVGGFEQALNRLGGTCVFASEIDRFATQAYETLYGGDHLYGDVTKIDAQDVPDHDLLVGGFPCQSFSVAGKRGGFDDARGTLFFEIARIASVKQPSALLLENVKGLVNHDKGNTLDTMIRTLNEIGYVVDFEIVNSKYFDVPQNRERIFIVAIRNDLVDSETFSEESTKGQTIVPKGKRRIGEWADVFNFDWPEQCEVTSRLRDVLETMVDEKYYLDEEKTAKLVAQLESKGPMIIQLPRGNNRGGEHEISPTVTSSYFEGNNLLSEPQMLGHVDLKGHDAIKRVYSPDGINPTLTTMGGGHREPKIAEVQSIGNVNPSGKGMNGQVYDIDAGLSPTLTTNKGEGTKMLEEVRPVLTPDRMEKRQNGRRFKEDGEESFTLTSQDRHGIAIREATTKGYAVAAEGDAVNFQFPDSKTRRGRVGKEIANTLEASTINQGTPVREGARYRIRKLTPLECFRLQGFPDEAHQALVDAGISDSQRYKMAGNAVTVNVIEALGQRLLPLIEGER